MKKYKIIHQHLIELTKTPTKDVKNGIKVIINPSKKWLKKNPSSKPIMVTDIKKMETFYELPPDVLPRHIKKVIIKKCPKNIK